MNEIKYGIVGIGNMGSAHARALFDRKIEHAKLGAVADICPSRLKWAQDNFGKEVLCFDNYKDMFTSGKIDAVIIATPHYSHTEIAKEAFKASLHVMLEKPAGVDCSEVEKMNEASKESDKAFGIMLNQRTTPLFETLKYYVELGVLGEVKRFSWMINNWYRTQSYYDSAGWRATWSTEGGGVLINQCPHNLDIWQWIMGMPESIRAFCKEGKFHNITVEDDVTIYAEYKNGATATFITSTGEYPGTNRLEISGSMGKAVAEDGVLKLFLLDEDETNIRFGSKMSMPTEKVTMVTISFKETEDGHILILKNFTNHILFGEKLIAPGTDGINSLRISNAAYLSAWTDSNVQVPASEELFTSLLKEKCEQEKSIVRNSSDAKEAAGDYSERWSVRW